MSDYRSNLWKFYLASILSGFAVFYNGVETLFYRHFDLTFEQSGFLAFGSDFAAFAAGFILMGIGRAFR